LLGKGPAEEVAVSIILFYFAVWVMVKSDLARISAPSPPCSWARVHDFKYINRHYSNYYLEPYKIRKEDEV
jgi:hypothetical protein